MSDFRHAFHHPDRSIEERFLAWTDRLVDPESGAPAPPDADFADIAETAGTVQRSAGLVASMSLPPARSEAIWKDLTNMPTTNTAIYPPTIASRDNAATGSATRHRIASTAGWRTYLTTAALIAAILVASIATVWRINDPFGGDEDGPGAARQPGIAASATPAQQTAGGCPLTSDMPIFVGEAPFLGGVEGLDPTIAVVEPDGDFGLLCSPLEEPEPLVTGVTNASSLPWPGTVLLELEDGSGIVYKLATDERISVNDFDPPVDISVPAPESPWMLTPANDDQTDWHIINVETMTTMLLSDELGGVLPEPTQPWIIWTPGAPTAVVSPTVDYALVNLPAVAQNSDLPGSLVVNETLVSGRWIESWGQVAVSPDGSAIAYQTLIDEVPSLRVEEAQSGEVLVEYENVSFDEPFGHKFAFSGDGESIVYLNGYEVWIGVYGGEQLTRRVDTDEMQPYAVHSTRVAGSVLIDRVTDDTIMGQGIGTSRALSVLDTRTGEIVDVDGLYVSPNFLYAPSLSSLEYIVTLVPNSQSESHVQLTDIASGEAVLTSEPIQSSVQALIDQFVIVSTDRSGSIAVVNVSNGNAMYLNATTDTTALIGTDRLSEIEKFAGVDWTIATSSSGRYLFAFGRAGVLDGDTEPPSDEEWLSMSLLSSEPQWGIPTDTAPVGLIIGIPTEESDEPRSLEAQKVTPLEASPVATPATPAAQTSGCDLSQDIHIVTSADVLPWDRAVAVPNDGTLTLECDDQSTVVAEGIADIQTTGWPGAVVATMDDGTLRGINLVTGATGDFGPASVLTESVSPRSGVSAAPGMPWAAIPANREVTDWRFIDLRTMESILLSDEIGGVLPGSTPAFPYAYTADALVVGFPGRLPTDRSASIPGTLASPPPGATVGELPSENAALVIDGSLGNRHWTEISNRTMTPAAISPDGELLAVEQFLDDNFTVRVERLSDGELIADTGIDLDASDSYLVLDDEAGLMHLSQDRLDLVTWNPELATETLLEFEPGEQPFILTQTADPDVALVTLLHADGTPAPVGSDSGASVSPIYPDGTLTGYLVNTASGEVIDVPGLLQSQFQPGYSDGTPPHHVLVAGPDDVDSTQTTIQLIDVTSGEIVAESGPVDASPDIAAIRSTTDDGADSVGMAFYPDGRAIVLDSASGESIVIEAPNDAEGMSDNAVWYFFPGGDGSYVTVTPDFGAESARVFIRQLDPDAKWIEIPADAFLGFIPGAGALPDATPVP